MFRRSDSPVHASRAQVLPKTGSAKASPGTVLLKAKRPFPWKFQGVPKTRAPVHKLLWPRLRRHGSSSFFGQQKLLPLQLRDLGRIGCDDAGIVSLDDTLQERFDLLRGFPRERGPRALDLLIWRKVAGVVGFEPTIHGTKNRCLTTWLHPNGERLITPLVRRVQGPYRKIFGKEIVPRRGQSRISSGATPQRYSFRAQPRYPPAEMRHQVRVQSPSRATTPSSNRAARRALPSGRV